MACFHLGFGHRTSEIQLLGVLQLEADVRQSGDIPGVVLPPLHSPLAVLPAVSLEVVADCLLETGALASVGIAHASISICAPSPEHRLAIRGMYAGFNSMPTALRFSLFATARVVPLPAKGSRTVSSGRLPARMHGSTNASGNVAKWASG